MILANSISERNWNCYRLCGYRFAGAVITIGGSAVGERATEGAELIPVVTAGEDAAQGEDDDQEQRGAEREAQRRPRRIHMRRRRIWTLHYPLNPNNNKFLHFPMIPLLLPSSEGSKKILKMKTCEIAFAELAENGEKEAWMEMAIWGDGEGENI